MKQNNKGKKEVIFEYGNWVWLHLSRDRFLNEKEVQTQP